MAKQLEADIERGLEPLSDLEGVETVVGVPFYDEDDTLPGVVQTACRGLATTGLAGKSLVICVGPEGSLAALEAALTRSGPDHGVRVHIRTVRPGPRPTRWVAHTGKQIWPELS